MTIKDTFREFAVKFPERNPGSEESRTVLAAIKEQTSAWGGPSETQKIPVHTMTTSILVFGAGSLIATWWGLSNPLAGMLFTLVMVFLLFRETTRPFLARVRAKQTENLIATIPARSKENQRVIFVTSYTTDDFIQPAPRITTRAFLTILISLEAAVILLQVLAWVFGSRILSFLSLIPIAVTLGMIFFPKQREPQDPSLDNCGILLELGSILVKARPLSTTVSFFFCGSRSLNSGVQKLPQFLKGGPSLTYIVDLINLNDKRINIVTADGGVISKPSESLLVETLMEVGREKKLPTQEFKFNQITEAYPLKFRGFKTVSVTNPLSGYAGDAPDQDLRELLIGLIRKLDH